jgi:hypothetical protein
MKTTRYELIDDKGDVISQHNDYDAAFTAAEEYAGEGGVAGHDGDIDEGGDKTLVWASERDSHNDSGQRAIASIRSYESEMTAEEFVDWANSVLVEAGIGKYDDGSAWYYYEINADGVVCACDYSECLKADDWQSITEADLQAEAASYVECTQDI